METPELKPCPFCGSVADVDSVARVHFGRCLECDAYGPSGKNRQESVEKWNARAEVKAHDVEKMRNALERIAKWSGEFPPTGRFHNDGTEMSYGWCFGSNGERDFMRAIAQEVLSAEVKAEEKGAVG